MYIDKERESKSNLTEIIESTNKPGMLSHIHTYRHTYTYINKYICMCTWRESFNIQCSIFNLQTDSINS